jgi:hypothetical protein
LSVTDLSRRKRIVFSALPSLLSALVLIIAAEAYLRHKFDAIQHITGVAEWKTATWKTLTYFWDQYHPTFGWTNLPGYESDERVPFRVRINSQGLRADRDYELEPAPGIHRLAVLGDSSTFGEEVDDDATFPHFLEQHLEDTEVLNFGVHGFGLGQMMLRMEQEAFRFYPDRIVVVLLLPEDIGRVPQKVFSHAKPAFSVDNGRLVMSNSPVPIASQMPWLYRHSYVAAWLFARAEAYPELKAASEYGWVTRLLLERIRADCAKREIPLTVVGMAGAGAISQSQSNRAMANAITGLRAEIRGLELDLLDLIDDLTITLVKSRKAGKAQLLVKEHGHWARPANCLIAEKIAEHLATQDAGLSLRADRPLCPL